MLTIVILFKKCLFRYALFNGHLQFGAEIPEHGGQGLPIHDTEDGNGVYKERGNNGQEFLSHRQVFVRYREIKQIFEKTTEKAKFTDKTR